MHQELSQTGFFCLQLQNANLIPIIIHAAGVIVFHIIYSFSLLPVWCLKSKWIIPPTLTNKSLLNPSTISNDNQMQVTFHHTCRPINITSVLFTATHFEAINLLM